MSAVNRKIDSTVSHRPRLCEECGDRPPSRNTPIHGWICYVCVQRIAAGKPTDAPPTPKPTPTPEPVCPPPAAVEPPVVSVATLPSAPDAAPSGDAGGAPLPPDEPEASQPDPEILPPVPAAPTPKRARRRPPVGTSPLTDAIRDAMIADPTVSSSALAARLDTSSGTVRSCVSILRHRGVLPPAPPRPEGPPPGSLRARLIDLIAQHPGIGSRGASRHLGVGEGAVHDAVHYLRGRGLIAKADPNRPGCYPATTCLPETPMPVTDPAAVHPTPATVRDVDIAIAEALSIDEPEEATQEDILQAARAQGDSVARLIDEKRRLSNNLEVSRSNLDAANGMIRDWAREFTAITATIPARYQSLTRAEAVERLEQEVADLRGERAHLRDQLDSERVVSAECAKLILENSALLSERNNLQRLSGEAAALVSDLRSDARTTVNTLVAALGMKMEINEEDATKVQAAIWLYAESNRQSASRLTLTREDLDARIADFRAADEAEGEAEDFATAADTGRPANIFGIDLDAADLRALAALRTEQARVLRQRALEGR